MSFDLVIITNWRKHYIWLPILFLYSNKLVESVSLPSSSRVGCMIISFSIFFFFDNKDDISTGRLGSMNKVGTHQTIICIRMSMILSHHIFINKFVKPNNLCMILILSLSVSQWSISNGSSNIFYYR